MLINIPKFFYNDHVERDLPAPVILEEFPRYYVIDAYDAALSELISDARHYASGGCDQISGTLKASAQALLRSIRRQLTPSITVIYARGTDDVPDPDT